MAVGSAAHASITRTTAAVAPINMTRSGVLPATESSDLLITNPIETEEILKYLSAFKEDEGLIHSVTEFTSSDDAMYNYQVFEILRWMVEEKIGTESSLSLARAQVQDQSKPTWLRSYAFALLGQFGDDADFATIVSESLGALWNCRSLLSRSRAPAPGLASGRACEP